MATVSIGLSNPAITASTSISFGDFRQVNITKAGVDQTVKLPASWVVEGTPTPTEEPTVIRMQSQYTAGGNQDNSRATNLFVRILMGYTWSAAFRAAGKMRLTSSDGARVITSPVFGTNDGSDGRNLQIMNRAGAWDTFISRVHTIFTSTLSTGTLGLSDDDFAAPTTGPGIYVGGDRVQALYLGAKRITKVYLGDTEL